MEYSGFYRIAGAVPRVHCNDVEFNCKEIIRLSELAQQNACCAVVFPELAITGTSCGDVFRQNRLLKSARNALCQIADAFIESNMIIVVGLPWLYGDKIYNAAAVLQSGRIMGISLKQYIDPMSEGRIFSSGAQLNEAQEIEFSGYRTYIGGNQIFKAGGDFSFGIEIGSDSEAIFSPGRVMAGAGAGAIFNPGSARLLAGGDELKCGGICAFSSTMSAAYVAVNSGVSESTTYGVHGSCSMIADSGRILAVTSEVTDLTAREKFGDSEIIYADIDFESLNYRRRLKGTYRCESAQAVVFELDCIEVSPCEDLKYSRLTSSPFLPDNEDDWAGYCKEIIEIQSAALARRISFTHAEKVVLGISGGLDSTLALLVCCEAFKLLGRDCKDILAVTMPGFGTSDRTYRNAQTICNELGVELQEIRIADACVQHFSDIGHDHDALDVTYENAQARERTQILMDLANKHNGLVIGTGDLSEIALGWCTFNGDHMAMYSVNCNVPKSLIRIIVEVYGETHSSSLAKVLNDIVLTPVSPELLPGDENDEIKQQTEKIVGSYDLHDFFLYHFVKNGASPEKVIFMAQEVFSGEYEVEEIKRTAGIFFKRFFSQQFKRNCAPDGPQVLDLNLSSHGGWEMPSDVYIGEFKI